MESFDITLPNIHIENILKTKNVDKEEIKAHLTTNDPEIRLYKETNKPAIKVTFYRLDVENPDVENAELLSFPINSDSRIDMLIHTKSDKLINYGLIPVKSCYLWDLSKFSKVDILRCGRFKKNDFHPITKEEPLEMDLGVSREHSLICYYNSQMYYIDYGTSSKIEDMENKSNKDSINHYGSKNGSWIYSDFLINECIKNACVEWKSNDIIGIGTFIYNLIIRNNKLKLFHQFSFEYEILS
ncbi:MAG: hypothetical protein ACD_79C01022G0002 [uncultured bacterium]|nr:MAG: hypothetical protein ACD_79C01022G0002 [uncultured bacterium]